jgi:proteasome lid subunit RPN8/RPN11
MFSTETLDAFKRDAVARYPEESCGLILTSGEYVPLPNAADDPLESFFIAGARIVPYLGNIAAIVHSHPDGPDCPSESDMQQQLAWNLPFGIVSTDGVGCLPPFFWGEGIPIPPLIGRGFRHGVTDCYALVRDYFRVNLGVKLSEYPRQWEWWKHEDARLYEKYFAQEGFYKIEEREVREHDCFLAQIRSDTPNHAGVYVGKNMILHHLTSRSSANLSDVSRREPIGSWHKFICGFWVRHESLRDAPDDQASR